METDTSGNVASVDAETLSRAVVVWTGWGETASPVTDDSRLAAEFGASRAADLGPQVRQLADEFYESDARHSAADVAAMGDRAAAEFCRRHPEISDEAVKALAWSYTYDFR